MAQGEAQRSTIEIAGAEIEYFERGAGEPLLGVPALIHYPDTVPFRVVAAAAGLVLLPLVSRATQRIDAPRHLQNLAHSESAAAAAGAVPEGAPA